LPKQKHRENLMTDLLDGSFGNSCSCGACQRPRPQDRHAHARQEADIILVRTDRLNVMPLNNAVGAVLANMGPQNVDAVLIAGKVVKRNGAMLGISYDCAPGSATKHATAFTPPRR
jgi:hypothetical protein